MLQERNWIPSLALWMVIYLFNAFCVVNRCLDEDFVPVFPITVTGEIRKAREA